MSRYVLIIVVLVMADCLASTAQGSLFKISKHDLDPSSFVNMERKFFAESTGNDLTISPKDLLYAQSDPSYIIEAILQSFPEESGELIGRSLDAFCRAIALFVKPHSSEDGEVDESKHSSLEADNRIRLLLKMIKFIPDAPLVGAIEETFSSRVITIRNEMISNHNTHKDGSTHRMINSEGYENTQDHLNNILGWAASFSRALLPLLKDKSYSDLEDKFKGAEEIVKQMEDSLLLSHGSEGNGGMDELRLKRIKSGGLILKELELEWILHMFHILRMYPRSPYKGQI